MNEKTYTKRELLEKSFRYLKTLPFDTPVTLSGFLAFLFSESSFPFPFPLPDSPLFDRELFVSLYADYRKIKQAKAGK